jgi:3-hydroxyisobutyrate dehydrogenase-like beta-hydroxyacid dehydrogenase
MDKTIGFIGVGAMGEPMAANLLKAGYRLRIYNRTVGKIDRLTGMGARGVKTTADAAEPGSVVVTMLANDDALMEVMLHDRSVVEKLGKGGVHLSMSTVSPATARRLAEDHVKSGVAYVSAPVFGRPDAAAGAKLWIPYSGPQAAKARVEPLLDVLGQGTYDLGEDTRAANVMKLAGNFLLLSAVEAMAEAMAFSEKNGVAPGHLKEMLFETLFACPVYKIYGGGIAEKRFETPGFKLALGLKDAGLVEASALASDVNMPFADVLVRRLAAAMDAGHGDWDLTALALESRKDAGLD